MATLPRSKAGTKVIVDVTEDGFHVKPTTRKKDRFSFPYTENELLADLTPDKAHADELANLMASEYED